MWVTIFRMGSTTHTHAYMHTHAHTHAHTHTHTRTHTQTHTHTHTHIHRSHTHHTHVYHNHDCLNLHKCTPVKLTLSLPTVPDVQSNLFLGASLALVDSEEGRSSRLTGNNLMGKWLKLRILGQYGGTAYARMTYYSPIWDQQAPLLPSWSNSCTFGKTWLALY